MAARVKITETLAKQKRPTPTKRALLSVSKHQKPSSCQTGDGPRRVYKNQMCSIFARDRSTFRSSKTDSKATKYAVVREQASYVRDVRSRARWQEEECGGTRDSFAGTISFHPCGLPHEKQSQKTKRKKAKFTHAHMLVVECEMLMLASHQDTMAGPRAY